MFRNTRSVAILFCTLALATACSHSTPTSSGGSNPTSRTSGASGITVDLTFTGADAAVLQGTKGTCSSGDRFAFYLSGSDYPALGPSGAFQIDGTPNRPEWKLLIGNDGFLSGFNSGLTVSQDTKTVTLNADVTGERAGVKHHEHIQGTIVCG
jgi:hypothetical protein